MFGGLIILPFFFLFKVDFVFCVFFFVLSVLVLFYSVHYYLYCICHVLFLKGFLWCFGAISLFALNPFLFSVPSLMLC